MSRTNLLSLPGRHRPAPAQPPLQLTLQAGRADDRVQLMHGDNLGALRQLARESAGKFTLTYLDPPFFTCRGFDKISRSKVPGEAPVRVLTPAFDDHWDSLDDYLDTLRARLVLIRELMAPHGSVVVHVDPRTSHYVKVMGDQIFGVDAFASEIVWRYRRWPSKTPNFQRVHDVLLRWVADPSSKPRFTQLYEELAPSTKKTWGEGRQRAVFDKAGRRRRSSTEQETSPGAPMGDVWEISIVAPVAHERTGYPTQKPEALLERLILSCSEPGDLVLDPYMGSGTTIAVAARLGRSGVGIDQSDTAIAVATERLRREQVAFGLWASHVAAEQAQQRIAGTP